MKKADAIRERADRIRALLAKLYPTAKCELDYENPFQLLVATILSAQCTDVRVNLTTPALFKRYPSAAALAKADTRELEKMIQPTGFFRSKAKSLMSASKDIVEKHGGDVPDTLDELVALHGVGRKTANVVLGNAFGVPGITVDTHVKRLSNRMGLTKHADPEKIEQDLMKLIPEKEWTMFSHRMIFHGRQVCFARKPKCSGCLLNEVCPQMGVKEKA